MDTMGTRLRRAMALRKVTIPAMVAAGVMSRANVYLILKDTTRPDMIRDDTVAKMCKFLKVNREWLLYGKGPIEGRPNQPVEEGWRDVKGFAQAVGLGVSGAEAQEYAETHALKFRAASLSRKRLQPDKLAVMYGEGDSMLPRIHPGDAILFDTSDTRVRDGALYVVQVHGIGNAEYQVKRALVLDDTVYFAADNPAGAHGWLKPRKQEAKRSHIEVIGRVRWIGSWED